MTFLDMLIEILAVVGAFTIARAVGERARLRWRPPQPPASKIILLYFDEFGAMTPITEYGATVDVFSVHERDNGRTYRHTLKANRHEIEMMLIGEKWQREPVTAEERRSALKVVSP